MSRSLLRVNACLAGWLMILDGLHVLEVGSGSHSETGAFLGVLVIAFASCWRA